MAGTKKEEPAAALTDGDARGDAVPGWKVNAFYGGRRLSECMKSVIEQVFSGLALAESGSEFDTERKPERRDDGRDDGFRSGQEE